MDASYLFKILALITIPVDYFQKEIGSVMSFMEIEKMEEIGLGVIIVKWGRIFREKSKRGIYLFIVLNNLPL